MASCSWAMLVTETAYKTPATPTTPNADHLVLELLDDDPVAVESVPQNEQLYSWLACGEPDRAIGETAAVSGTIRTLLYPAQAPLLLGWAFRKVDQSGTPDIPWTTSEPDGQMASMALDFAYRDDSGTERKGRYLGGKVTRASLAADRNTRGGAFVLELDVTFSSVTTTSATAPAASDYPSGAPYFLSATSAGVVLNSATIADYESLTIEANYTTTARFDEAAAVKRIRHHRDEITLALSSLLKFTPDWRALRDNRSTFAAEVTMLYPGGSGQQELTWDFGANCRVADDGWQKQLQLASDRTQSLNVMCQYDRTAGRLLELTIGTQS